MERHRIMDFGYDPEQHSVWVRLDGPPTRPWRMRAGRSVEVGSDVTLRPGADQVPEPRIRGEWMYLDASLLDEVDAFTLLSACVHRANSLLESSARSRSHQLDED